MTEAKHKKDVSVHYKGETNDCGCLFPSAAMVWDKEYKEEEELWEDKDLGVADCLDKCADMDDCRAAEVVRCRFGTRYSYLMVSRSVNFATILHNFHSLMV